MLGAISYMMLALGSLLAHLLSKVVPWLAGLCVLNVVILVTHFIAIGLYRVIYLLDLLSYFIASGIPGTLMIVKWLIKCHISR